MDAGDGSTRSGRRPSWLPRSTGAGHIDVRTYWDDMDRGNGLQLEHYRVLRSRPGWSATSRTTLPPKSVRPSVRLNTHARQCFVPVFCRPDDRKQEQSEGTTMSRMGSDRSLATGEEVVAILHPHWKTLVRPILLTFVVVAVLLIGEVLIPASRAADGERLALAVVAIVLLMWCLTIPLLRWRTTAYELTTRRLRLRDGIIARNGRDIPLSRITDVSFRKGPLDRLLGSGPLVVESAGEHGQLRLTEIPNAERVQATLFQLVEDERARADRDDSHATGP